MTLLPLFVGWCVVCHQPGSITKKALNGLPIGIVACDSCREAVKRRAVGVVQYADGTLHVTDARVKAQKQAVA